MKKSIGAVLVLGAALAASPLVFSAQERAGLALAAHCVDMLKDYLGGGIGEFEISAVPASPATGDKQVLAAKRYAPVATFYGGNIALMAPTVYVEYRAGKGGARTDAACTYLGYAPNGASLPKTVEVDMVMARSKIFGRDYRPDLANSNVSYESVKTYLMAPYRWAVYRAEVD